MRNKILALIFNSIDELNSQSGLDSQLSKTKETVIFGKASPLDSLGLVNLIVSLEQAINDEFNLEITLADERAMSLENSPFKTVSTLADYILLLLKEKENG
jgi:acyl carrier protein